MTAALTVPTAFVFPPKTGAPQHDGLAILRHVMAYGTTPTALEDVKLAIHVAPLAYLGTPEPKVVAALNRAVDTLHGAARRLTVVERDERGARLKKLAALFDGLDDRPNLGPMAPLAPITPPPPVSDGVLPQVEELAKQLAAQAKIGLAEARDIIVKRLRDRQKQAHAPEVA